MRKTPFRQTGGSRQAGGANQQPPAASSTSSTTSSTSSASNATSTTGSTASTSTQQRPSGQPGGGSGGAFNTGQAGIFRLFNEGLGGQASWLLPLALLLTGLEQMHIIESNQDWGAWLMPVIFVACGLATLLLLGARLLPWLASRLSLLLLVLLAIRTSEKARRSPKLWRELHSPYTNLNSVKIQDTMLLKGDERAGSIDFNNNLGDVGVNTGPVRIYNILRTEPHLMR